MSSGKESARDKIYGRRGGRWATDTGDAPDALTYYLREVHKTRIQALRADKLSKPLTSTERKWPIETLPRWREIARDSRHPLNDYALEIVKLVDG